MRPIAIREYLHARHVAGFRQTVLIAEAPSAALAPLGELPWGTFVNFDAKAIAFDRMGIGSNCLIGPKA